MEKMFELASRQKLRFESPKGLLSVEDLWDLPLTTTRGNVANLDDVARAVAGSIRAAGEIEQSFVTPAQNTKSAELALKLEIVKYVISVRIAERDAAQSAQDKKEKKQRLLNLIDQKENEALSQKSLDELRQMANEL